MKNKIKQIIKVYHYCKKTDIPFWYFIFQRFFNKVIRKKNIYTHSKGTIIGYKNIITKAPLSVGIINPVFNFKNTHTILNVKGKLIIHNSFKIGRGCRIFVGPNAICEFNSGYINANTLMVIYNGLKIGKNCAISWNCEFLDEDFHEIFYENKKIKSKNIEIGDNVWIGSGTKILKGVKIGDGNIIAANSLVVSSFLENNVLIAGNPAKIIKRNVRWSKIDKTYLREAVLSK